MALVRLENGDLRCEIEPRAGASIVSLAARLGSRWVPILRPTPPEALRSQNSSEMASFVLAPYSNRIAGARFTFAGRRFALRPNTPDGHAIHGDVRKRPWRIAEAAPHRARFLFDSSVFADVNFPFPFRVALAYELRGPELRAELELESTGSEPMPAGLGHHPYFRRTLIDPTEEVEVQARVTGEYRGLVPTAPAGPLSPEHDFSTSRPIAGADIDACFAGWDGKATLTWPGSGVRAEIQCGPPLGHLVLYTPRGKPFFALEPVSHANNGFNLLADGDRRCGVQILQPGEAMRALLALRIST